MIRNIENLRILEFSNKQHIYYFYYSIHYINRLLIVQSKLMAIENLQAAQYNLILIFAYLKDSKAFPNYKFQFPHTQKLFENKRTKSQIQSFGSKNKEKQEKKLV